MDTVIVLSPPHPLQQQSQQQIHGPSSSTQNDEASSNSDKNPKSNQKLHHHTQNQTLSCFQRKRKKSVHGTGAGSNLDLSYVPPYKTRKFHGHGGQQRRNSGPCPGPNPDWTFLLGGNVHDPLNLNGLQPSDNASTPKTSPMPIPDFKLKEVPIYVPKDPGDPLKLGGDADTKGKDVIKSSMDPRSKERHHHRSSFQSDPIVSPVVCTAVPFSITTVQKVAEVKQNEQKLGTQDDSKPKCSSTATPDTTKVPPLPSTIKFHPKNAQFQYGNYNQYYGYRNPANSIPDPRLRAIRPEWIHGKDILDIGCNIGHLTLTIGRDLQPRKIVGIDIDPNLIKIANKNIKHYVDKDPVDGTIQFPKSCAVLHGRLQPQPLSDAIGISEQNQQPESSSKKKIIPFPYNVLFRQENYVLSSDSLLSTITPQYDLILCFSVTKWVHLNFGDFGLQRFFQRAFLNLRPGGFFILEPQPWSSYKKKKKMTEQTYTTFQTIRFYPTEFNEYLLKTVGFESVKQVGIPAHHSKGFQRPIYVFQKKKLQDEEQELASDNKYDSGGNSSSSSPAVVSVQVPESSTVASTKSLNPESKEPNETVSNTIS